MKNFLKGLAAGLAIAVLIQVVPVFATGIEAVFNSVRINLSGVNKAQWGESYTLDNGDSVPFSILYGGTTYLPLRKIGELNGFQIHWNGDTKTVSMTEELVYPSKSNPNEFHLFLAEEQDQNGNLWTYYAVKGVSNKKYIHIYDSARGFARIYEYQSGRLDLEQSNAYKNIAFEGPLVLDDGIVFATSLDGKNTYLRKISFASSVNTQDGEVLSAGAEYILFGDLMIAYGNDIAEAINIKTGNRAEIKANLSRNPLIFPREIISYEDGYLTFTNSINRENAGDLHKYRVAIELADTPVVGEVEDLGEI